MDTTVEVLKKIHNGGYIEDNLLQEVDDILKAAFEMESLTIEAASAKVESENDSEIFLVALACRADNEKDEKDLVRMALGAAAEQNLITAQVLFGMKYVREEDSAQAALLYLDLASLRHPDAMLVISNVLSEGMPFIKKDLYQSHRWLVAASECNHPEACFTLALMYELGSPPCEKQYTAALSLYRKAASLGHIDAQLNIAKLYLLGQELADPTAATEKAVDWLTTASRNGSFEARHLLNRMPLKSGIQQHTICSK